MDWTAILSSLVINLIFSILGYLLVPMVLVLIGKKYDAKKLKRINIINCIVVWLLFRFIQIELGNEPSSGVAVFLWGAVGHLLLKKYCLEEVHIPKQSKSVEKINPVKNCSQRENSIDSYPKQRADCEKQHTKVFYVKPVFIILFSVLFAASLIGNIILVNKNNTLGEKNNELSKSNYSLVNEVLDLKNENSHLTKDKEYYYTYWQNNNSKISLFDSWIVFIENDGTYLYHTYDCDKFVGNDCWAHNIEYAKYLGYNPCPLCYK